MYKPNVCVVSIPANVGDNTKRSLEFIRPLEPSVRNVVLITGPLPEEVSTNSNIYIICIGYDSERQFLPVRILKHAIIHLKICFHLLAHRRDFEIVLFHLGGQVLLLPIVTARLLHKKVALFIVGSFANEVKMWSIGGKVANVPGLGIGMEADANQKIPIGTIS